MSNTCIDILADIVEKCRIPKQEVLDAIDDVHYYSCFNPPEEHKASVNKQPIIYEINASELSLFSKKQSKKQIIPRGCSSSRIKKFINRLNQYEVIKNKRMKQQKEILKKQEEVIYSFKPNINTYNKYHNKIPAYERLHSIHKEIRKKHREKKERNDAKAKINELAECTFNPTLYTRPKSTHRSHCSRSRITTTCSNLNKDLNEQKSSTLFIKSASTYKFNNSRMNGKNGGDKVKRNGVMKSRYNGVSNKELDIERACISLLKKQLKFNRK